MHNEACNGVGVMNFVSCNNRVFSTRCRPRANVHPQSLWAYVRWLGSGRSAATCAALLIGISSMAVPVFASPRTLPGSDGAQSAVLVEPLAASSFGPALTSAELATDAGGFGVLAEVVETISAATSASNLAPLAGGRDPIARIQYLCPDRLYTEGPAWNNHTYAQCGTPSNTELNNDTVVVVVVRAGSPPTVPTPPTNSPPILWPCGGTGLLFSSTVSGTTTNGAYGIFVR